MPNIMKLAETYDLSLTALDRNGQLEAQNSPLNFFDVGGIKSNFEES